MADPIINIADNSNILRIVQDSEDLVKIADTKITQQNQITLVETNNVENLSYMLNVSPPVISSATGTVGELRFDENYLYVCVQPNQWKRLPLSSF